MRGTLIAFTNVAAGIGIFSVYTLNAWFPWRIVALIALAVPITSTILLCFVSREKTLIKTQIVSDKKLNFLSGSRDTSMVAVEKSNGASGKIAVLAAGLGLVKNTTKNSLG